MSVTLEQAQAARASGKSLYGYVTALGITDDNARRRAVNELGALLVQVDHPEFNTFAEQLRDKGYTVEVEFIADAIVEINLMNYAERRDKTNTFGSYGVGLEGKYLGRLISRAFRGGYTYEYEGWNGVYMQRRYSRKRRTSKWLVATKQLLIDARVPVQSDYDRMFAMRAARQAREGVVDRRHALEKLVSQHGKRAFEILLQSNAQLPEDFKEVVSQFMDLTEGLSE
jgi:hypothetical protein